MILSRSPRRWQRAPADRRPICSPIAQISRPCAPGEARAIEAEVLSFSEKSSAALIDREFLLEFLGALLFGGEPLGAQKELDDVLVAGAADGAQDLDQFLDQDGEFFAGDVVVGPAKVAMAMENLGDGFLQLL